MIGREHQLQHGGSRSAGELARLSRAPLHDTSTQSFYKRQPWHNRGSSAPAGRWCPALPAPPRARASAVRSAAPSPAAGGGRAHRQGGSLLHVCRTLDNCRRAASQGGISHQLPCRPGLKQALLPPTCGMTGSTRAAPQPAISSSTPLRASMRYGSCAGERCEGVVWVGRACFTRSAEYWKGRSFEGASLPTLQWRPAGVGAAVRRCAWCLFPPFTPLAPTCVSSRPSTKMGR